MLPMGEWVFGLGTPKPDLLSACADNLMGKRKKEKNVKRLINSRHQQNCSQWFVDTNFPFTFCLSFPFLFFFFPFLFFNVLCLFICLFIFYFE